MDQQVRNNTESTYGNAGVPLLGFSGEHKKPKGSRSWCSAISCHTKNEKKAKTPKLLKKNPSISETIRKRSSSVPNHSRLNLPPLRLKAPQQEDEIQSDELMDVGQAMMENEAIITTSNSLVSGMALPPALQHTRYERAKTAGPEPSNPAPVAVSSPLSFTPPFHSHSPSSSSSSDVDDDGFYLVSSPTVGRLMRRAMVFC